MPADRHIAYSDLLTQYLYRKGGENVMIDAKQKLDTLTECFWVVLFIQFVYQFTNIANKMLYTVFFLSTIFPNFHKSHPVSVRHSLFQMKLYTVIHKIQSKKPRATQDQSVGIELDTV